MRRPAAGVLLLWAVAGVGCFPPAPGTHPAVEGGDPVQAVAPDPDTLAADQAVADPGVLGLVRSAPSQFLADSGQDGFEVALRSADQVVGHARRYGMVTRDIALRQRTPELSNYPCTSCHLGRRVVMAPERIRDAHQNIQPVHPRATGAVCATCHAEDDVERLRVATGDRPTLDHAYRLCAQCHFQQVTDWATGAHGKRLDGWQGRRVVMGCADCHDPHAPALESRVPFRGPVLPARGGHE